MSLNLVVVSVLTLAAPLTAEQVESDVTAPIEHALLQVPGVQRVHSVSGPGRSSYVEVSLSSASPATSVAAIKSGLASHAPKLPIGSKGHEVFVPEQPLLLR